MWAERRLRTGQGRTKGKPAWMSPEQARAETLDARSDLFSVGSVLFALLTDVLPFPATNDLQVLTLVSRGESPSPEASRPDLPPELCALVRKTMARNPRDRFNSAEELLLALEQLRRGVLEPAGRSELENFLRALSEKDGDTAITGQPLPPARPIELEEWIPRVPASRRAHARRSWVAGLSADFVVFGLMGAGAWWLQARPVVVRAAPLVLAPSLEPDEPEGWEDFTLPQPTEDLQVSARLAPKQKSKANVAVLLESLPAGAVIKVDDRELGRTPATVQLKNGQAYELCFESKGNPPVRQRLMLTPRAGRLPRVILRSP